MSRARSRKKRQSELGHLECVSTKPEHGKARPQFQPEFQFTDASTRHRADPPKDEMLPLSSHWTLQLGLPRTSPEEASVQGEGVGDERGPLCKVRDKNTGRAPSGD